MKEEITNIINKLLKPDNFKYYANYGYAYPLLAIDADTIIEFIEKSEEENKSLQFQLKAKEEVIKEALDKIETLRMEKWAIMGTDIMDIMKILSKGENK